MKRSFLALTLTLFAAPTWAAVTGTPVAYDANGLTMKGYLAHDPAIKGKRPGVLVVHEWWGHDDYARERARMLAKLGYTALAVDMYGDGKQAHHPTDAKAMATAVGSEPTAAKVRFDAALSYLKKHATVDVNRIAAIGYCVGGTVVLNMARAGEDLGEDLKGVASFHGGLGTATPAQPGKLKAQILVLTGTADPMIPAEQVAAFEQEMKDAGASYRVVSYPGAKHSFSNPAADKYGKRFDMPFAYDADADEKSWAALKEFLQKIFAQ